jgi:4-hydroxybenzoate polyprenyltransferase
MIAVLVEYIKIRIHLFQLIGLTILMSILVLSIDDALDIWMYSILFLFSSFIVFRIFDDAFSVKIDRKEHPERTYLIPGKFKSFKKITAIIIGGYLLSVGFAFSAASLIILLLLISSLALYILCEKQLFVLKLIPLLKYPVLLYCVTIISSNEVEQGVLISSFLLMAGFDSFDRVKRNSNHIWQPMLFLFCSSIFLFKPWLNYINILYILLPLLLIYRIRNKSMVPYFLIVFFPITFFILTHL